MSRAMPLRARAGGLRPEPQASQPFGRSSLSLVPSEPLITITQDSDGWFVASARYSPRHDIQTGMGMTEERAVKMLKRRLHTWDTTR